MLFSEARNPIFGETKNPWSLAHSPGGSSGGEAAAVASGMSPLGLGTDIGGSVRVPCSFCGVAGIKPTLDRLPMRGYRTVLPGQEVVRGMGGPIAREVRDLALLFRALAPMRLSSLDPRVPPLRWEELARVERLRVGWYVDDGLVAPSSAVVRAVEAARDALIDRGCEVRAFLPPDVPQLMDAYLAALSADGGKTVLDALAGGEIDPVLQPLRRLAQLPSPARWVAARTAAVVGEERLARMLRSMGEKSVAELWRLTDDVRAYRSRLLDAMDEAGIDVLVCPVFATPAVPHMGSKNFTLAASYSMLFNATQLPAGTVPVTRVRLEETQRSGPESDSLDKHAAAIDRASEGLPVGVQVVARAWAEPVVLAVMQAIESSVRGAAEFPRTPIEPGGRPCAA
jgi:fatty acid amide hydrolase